MNLNRVRTTAWIVRTLARSGLIPLAGPRTYRRMARVAKRYGLSPATTAAVSAIRAPGETAIVAEDGSATWAELEERSSALALGLQELAGRPDPTVALMARNSRGFVETVLATVKTGGRILLLNTGFAGPQLVDVVEREGADVLVYDDEFRDVVVGAAASRPAVICAGPTRDGERSLAEVAGAHTAAELGPPSRPGRMVLLTSGTSGTPKGAERGGSAAGIQAMAGFLDRIHLRAGDVTVIGAPMFHAWGFAGLTMTSARAGTIVVQRRFDAEATLAQVAEHRASVLWLVPVMLERIMNLPVEIRRSYDLSSLRVVALSGSGVRDDAVREFMAEVGPVVYNNYSSTEVGWASIATPRDLLVAPGTAGTPPRGTSVRILDSDGTEVPPGVPGRIFVRNDSLFEGYTGGGSKEVLDGFMSTGDVGHLDAAGRLFVDGRDDDMIVSGGENVYPSEVERLLANHDDVIDAAVIGVPDEEYGQRLEAFVVLAARADAEQLPDVLRSYVRDQLARHKVPRAITVLEELPRNAAGKVLKRDLRELATQTS